MIVQLRKLYFVGSVGLACLMGLVGAGPAMAQGQAPGKEVDRTTGQYMYTRFCIACHGPDGKGTAVGNAIVARPTGPMTAEQIIKVVRTPLAMMPTFPPRLLSDE